MEEQEAQAVEEVQEAAPPSDGMIDLKASGEYLRGIVENYKPIQQIFAALLCGRRVYELAFRQAETEIQKLMAADPPPEGVTYDAALRSLAGGVQVASMEPYDSKELIPMLLQMIENIEKLDERHQTDMETLALLGEEERRALPVPLGVPVSKTSNDGLRGQVYVMLGPTAYVARMLGRIAVKASQSIIPKLRRPASVAYGVHDGFKQHRRNMLEGERLVPIDMAAWVGAGASRSRLSVTIRKLSRLMTYPLDLFVVDDISEIVPSRGKHDTKLARASEAVRLLRYIAREEHIVIVGGVSHMVDDWLDEAKERLDQFCVLHRLYHVDDTHVRMAGPGGGPTPISLERPRSFADELLGRKD